MSGKLNTKNKGREDKGKSKGSSHANEDNEDLDFAVLRKPVPTSITGFAQARKIFDLATEELKDLLSSECDVLYECKVCRNIFRSLANFISHKRVYCKDKFNSSVHGHFIKQASTVSEIKKIKRTEQEYRDYLKSKNSAEARPDNIDDDRIPMSKDLTEIIERIAKKKGLRDGSSDQQVVLQRIPSSKVAMFQNMDSHRLKSVDNMRAQVKELDTMLSRNKAVLQSDGNFTIETSTAEAESVIQISDDDDNNDGRELKCKTCDLHFSTAKTLRFHMKHKHLESRLVYPCPDCLEIFSTSWSVYRHLFKVHRKTAAQIRRLRESIQAKAFRMNNPPASYEKRKNNLKTATAQKISEEERLDQENQAWMDNMEGDGEVPRCGGCGRTFERRAALAAHTYTCQSRSRALALGRRPEGKKIEIQIRKDYNKGPSRFTILNPDLSESKDTQTFKTADENDNDEQDNEKDEVKDDGKDEKDDRKDETKDDDEEDDDDPLDEAPVDEAPMDEAPMDIGDDDQKSNDSESPEKDEENKQQADVKPPFQLPFALQTEKSNLAAFKQRMSADVDFSTRMCKKCYIKFKTTLELYEHMAAHFKWKRYACKLCNFKDYTFESLPNHVKVVHKLKGDSDFYYSTLKAIDGTEAMIISRCLVESETMEQSNEVNETRTESRRPSRCSSDSSRLSDDSSSSATIKETGSRKRKMNHSKMQAKRKRESMTNSDNGEDRRNGPISMDKILKVIIGGDKESASIEENSSDFDDVEEKTTKKHSSDNIPSAVSRRPVRKKTKPKNADFEYDLSNLLKMEAQGYRDSQTVSMTTTPKPAPKEKKDKKTQPDTPSIADINNEHCGALVTMSKKSVERSAAHFRTSSFGVYTVLKEPRSSNIFVRPMLPKILSRGDKLSPRKDATDSSKDGNSPNKVLKPAEVLPSPSKDKQETKGKSSVNENSNFEAAFIKTIQQQYITSDKIDQDKKDNVSPQNKDIKPQKKDTSGIAIKTPSKDSLTTYTTDSNDSANTDKPTPNRSIPAVVPFQFRRQSLELMKNPLINKNITDFTKAGMKTKILVIKPINRNKGGVRAVNAAPLKFQTIKLKDPNKDSSLKEDKSDKVVVVKVPKADGAISRPETEKSDENTEVTETVTCDETSSITVNDSNEKCDTNEVLTENHSVRMECDEAMESNSIEAESVTSNAESVNNIVEEAAKEAETAETTA